MKLSFARAMVFAFAAFVALPSPGASIVQITAGPQDAQHDLSLLTLMPSPGPVGGGSNPAQFALHDHAYLSPQFPDPTHAFVLFEFDQAVIIDSIVVIQHTNGVTFLQHAYGDASASLSAGTLAMSSAFGDASGFQVMTEYTPDTFTFTDGGAGKFHQFVIAKGSHPQGWATYRFYLDYHAAAVPEVGTAWMLALGLLSMAGFGMRLRPSRAS